MPLYALTDAAEAELERREREIVDAFLGGELTLAEAKAASARAKAELGTPVPERIVLKDLRELEASGTPVPEGFVPKVIRMLLPRPSSADMCALFGELNLEEVREQGRHAKGEGIARATINFAVRLVEDEPAISRRRLLETLILNEPHLLQRASARPRVDAGGAVLNLPASDPTYLAARKRADRRLRRGFQLAGEPPALRHLV